MKKLKLNLLSTTKFQVLTKQESKLIKGGNGITPDQKTIIGGFK